MGQGQAAAGATPGWDRGRAAPWQRLFCALESPWIPLNCLGASALRGRGALVIRAALSYLFKRQHVLADAEFLLACLTSD